MDFLSVALSHLPLDFARGGGGGSGGGGGGGDGAIALVGYLPMHFLGAQLRKHGSSNVVASVGQQIVGWVISVIYGMIWIILLDELGAIIALGSLLGIGAGLYNWFEKIKQSKLVAKKLSAAGANDIAWNEQSLTDYSIHTFAQYQSDWSRFRTESMRTYMTPRYHYHASLLMYTLQLLDRKNAITNIRISNALIIDMHDSADNAQDRFTVGITAQAHDELIETTTGKLLFVDDNEFTEYWHFVRSGNAWLLDGISQATESSSSINNSLKSYAESNGFYYSKDMGWLFLPKRGYLFEKGKFGTSDINNHVVGVYKNRILIQLFTYTPMSGSQTAIKLDDSGTIYVIAQLNVPKNYGQIVVRHKKRFNFSGIKGLERVETEWTRFNDRYEVFATNAEQAASFELLEPTYMEQLEALPFDVNIEVVDNVIYLYTDEGKTDVNTYQVMLNLLYKAFEEMKL